MGINMPKPYRLKIEKYRRRNKVYRSSYKDKEYAYIYDGNDLIARVIVHVVQKT